MRHAIAIAFVFALLASGLAAAADQLKFSTGRISPGLAATLSGGQNLFIEVPYSSTIPIRFQARAFAEGASADGGQMMNASIAHPAGQGTALVWVAFSKPAKIDEIRVSAYDTNWNPLAIRSLPARLSWTGEAARRSQAPDWAQALIDSEKRQADIAREQAQDEAGDIFGMLIGLVIMAGVPAYLALQLYSFSALDGGWRAAAALPLLAMVPAVAHASLALAAGSNLWPIMVILGAPVALLYLAGLLTLRAFARNAFQ